MLHEYKWMHIDAVNPGSDSYVDEICFNSSYVILSICSINIHVIWVILHGNLFLVFIFIMVLIGVIFFS